MIQEVVLDFTTDALGDASVSAAGANFRPPARLLAVLYDRGDVDAGVDLTVDWVNYNIEEDVFAATGVAAADKIYYPRRLLQALAGIADLTGTSGGDREPPVFMGIPRLVVANGGNAKTGAVILVLQDEGRSKRMLHDIHLPFTTTAGGAATATAGFWPGPCRLIAAMWDFGGAAAGSDLTLTWDRYNVTENIMTVTDAGAADAVWYPRRLVQGLDGADLTGTAGGDREPPLILGRPSLTVAQGGATVSGELILVVETL